MRRWAALALFLAPVSAYAQDEPRFCPNRPSLGSSACITEPGRVHFEVSAVDWERDDTPDERQDTLLLGDFQARIGVGPTTEAQVSWTPYGHARVRDKLTGGVSRQGRVGDVRLGLRQNLRHPNGKGLSFGVEPFVTLPVGRGPIGAGDWGTGVVIPVTYEVSDALSVGLTSEADAAVDMDGDGRHFSGNEILTVNLGLTDTLTGIAELQVLRDDDPAGHVTQTFAAGGMSYQVAKTRAVYAEAVAGLNHKTPDVRVLGGVSVLF